MGIWCTGVIGTGSSVPSVASHAENIIDFVFLNLELQRADFQSVLFICRWFDSCYLHGCVTVYHHDHWCYSARNHE